GGRGRALRRCEAGRSGQLSSLEVRRDASVIRGLGDSGVPVLSDSERVLAAIGDISWAPAPGLSSSMTTASPKAMPLSPRGLSMVRLTLLLLLLLLLLLRLVLKLVSRMHRALTAPIYHFRPFGRQCWC
ncbi:hypothetical protein M440DRAFT_1422344, partial [Trichoderma longibrachiatum ATCC 18648]